MSNLQALRDYAAGAIDESALMAETTTDDDIREYEQDSRFMAECTAACLPIMTQMMMMDEAAQEVLDEETRKVFFAVQNYMVGQGSINEAATVRITNPRINVVHLSKQAQLKRLKAIITLKMGRRAKHKAYKKYKLGQMIKKNNREELDRAFGAKAERLAKKLYAQLQKKSKVAAIVDDGKANVQAKSKK